MFYKVKRQEKAFNFPVFGKLFEHRNLPCMIEFNMSIKNLRFSVFMVVTCAMHFITCILFRGGGTTLYGLYRYVPRNRVGFLEVLDP